MPLRLSLCRPSHASQLHMSLSVGLADLQSATSATARVLALCRHSTQPILQVLDYHHMAVHNARIESKCSISYSHALACR